MKDRLREIIRYKTHGKQKAFADLLGWRPQYLTNLLRGSEFGLKPVQSLLVALPEINARWLLLGQGEMLMDDHVSDIQSETVRYIHAILDLERFVAVMSPEELVQYEKMIRSNDVAEFGASVRASWIERLHELKQEKEIRIKQAMKQSDELCRQQTAKE